jgi:molecular chaperone DnaK (HSP70)
MSCYPIRMRLGIDFGTTRIVVAACDRGNYPVVTFEGSDGAVRDWFPPLVAVKDGARYYGWQAWSLQEDPSATVVRSLKRYLSEAGPRTPVEIGGIETPLSTLLAELASSLREALVGASNVKIRAGEELEVMLGVPASANSNQRFLTVDAFREAGFSVVGLLNEPSAASIEYGHSHREQTNAKQHILVYDLGGGTFDASLVELDERSHGVVASEGIPTLGGDDFDGLLADLAWPVGEELTQSEYFRLHEECRLQKESLNPNSRKVVLDLDAVRPGLGAVTIPVADFYEKCQVLVAETVHAVADLTSRTESLEAIYVTGGGSEMPLVARLLRETYGRKVKRSPYTRAATAIGLAIQADKSSGYVLRDQFTRYFGVWREWEGGRLMRFDPLFAKGTELPHAGEASLEQRRSYTAVHNIGHFRYLECSHLDEFGQPEGSITVWDEIRFPIDPALQELADLTAEPVRYVYLNQQIVETYRCGAGGELEVEIANLSAGYQRKYRLGRWGGNRAPIVPGKTKRAAPKKKAAGR